MLENSAEEAPNCFSAMLAMFAYIYLVETVISGAIWQAEQVVFNARKLCACNARRGLTGVSSEGADQPENRRRPPFCCSGSSG